MQELFGTLEEIEPKITSDLLNEAVSYWDGLRAGQAMPSRAAIDPMRITGLLPTIYIVIAEETGDFRYQLAGSMIEERYRLGSLKGKTPEEIAGHAAENVLGPYRRVRDEAVLFYREATLEWIGAAQKYTHYKALLMPLSDDGVRVNMILGVHDFVRGPAD
ncbi:MAG: hypothetical protein ACI9JL_004373 [Paracoccaceae bacterium]|jgi:hypothetical protein